MRANAIWYLFTVAKNTKAVFLLSYHDVTALNHALVARDLDLLASWGYPHWTLMVVPEAPRALRDAFCEQLSAFRKQGHELALHGCKHRADPTLKRSLSGRIALHLTGQEAEFAGLDATDSLNLLEASIRNWEHLGQGAAAGFVPPTWHAPEQLAEQALRVGWAFYEERLFLYLQHLGRVRRRLSFPVSFAGLPSWTHGLIRFSAQIISYTGGVPRLALHPGDLAGGKSIGIRNILEAWSAKGRAIQYRELVEETKFRA